MPRYCPRLKRFTDLCPGKLQRCASCNELKKNCFDYELSETDAFFFFFCSSLSHSLLLSNSIAIQLKCTIQTFSN